jgi:SAM-dependent methyltransferase
MGLARAINNVFSLLRKGEWREVYIRSLIFLRILDLKTVITEESKSSPDGYLPHSSVARVWLQQVLSPLHITKTDSIVDFGSGKGGALITLADYPFSKVTGIEISRELIRIAKRNLNLLRIKNVDMVCCDAANFTDIDEYNYFYFFNPFPCGVMKDVLENIKQSILRKNRRVTILYIYPVCHSTVMEAGIFKILSEHDCGPHKCIVYCNRD